MRFGVLGPLEARTADGEAVAVPEAKVRALLAALLAHDGPVSADRLIDDLWGAEPPGNPSNTLQTKVSQLRKAIGKELVAYRTPGYALAIEPDAVDAHRFRRLVAQAREAADPGTRRTLLADALALWRGCAFADFADEPFAQATIQRLAEERLAAQEEFAETRLELGEHAALAGELGELVTAHPLRERLRAVHVRALYRAGRQGEALASLADLRERLADELGVDPSPELAELQQAVLTQDAALAVPTEPVHNLPVPVTDLVGRDREFSQVRKLLGAARLVTLTGPGGVGKTRLAIESARSAAFRDGVRLVELAGIRADGDATCSLEHAVLAALGVQETTGTAPVAPADPLVDALRGKEILLVLDNCEHLIIGAAGMAARLLRALPGLRILATSREALGISGETLLPVPPLDVPLPGSGLADVRASGAVRLFTARAAATSPGFDIGAGNAASVAAICRRLDGIPLALELAATRVRVLGAKTLESRLDDRFGLLTSGPRDAPQRQRTLHAVIDWSWQLLPTAERTVLRRLAIHRDGCTLDSAESVCSGDGVRPTEVLDLLSRLVDRSLVVATETPAGGRRYRLLESVAAYCIERLEEAGEHETLRQRHNEHYLALAEQADPQLRGREQRQWLERLDAEAANLRATLDDAVQHSPDAALRLVNALFWYWFLRGRLSEAKRSLAAALAMGGGGAARAKAASWYAGIGLLTGEGVDRVEPWRDITDRTDRARARWFLIHAKTTVADLSSTERDVDELVAEFEELGDRWGLGVALSDRTTHRLTRGDMAAALRDAERSAELFQELGDSWGLAQASYGVGTVAQITGDYASAERHHTEALRGAEALGLWAEVAYQTSWLGRVALLTRDYARARELHTRAMRVAAERGFTPAEMYAETGLALGARREGRFDEAEHHLRRVLEWHRRVEFEPGNALILAELGFAAEQRGNLDEAREHHLAAHRIARRGTDPRAVALTLEGLAGAEALADHPAQAARLLGAAAAARNSVGAPLPPAERDDVDRITTAARKALGDKDFNEKYAQGTGLSLDEADALARPREHFGAS
ncbi:BTAD domain-containing putative transcriptional regulator [Saccharopolyspora sp. NPDC050389]|uniref:BTAD domain-containing putative transcriptional regulator n=1 Tax=Saccharopolyspora sp. NPDC050389 TaxID=3155516 RepID=UPI00340F3D02